jgi:hypothetical protein
MPLPSEKNIIHLMPDPVHPRFLRIYCVPKPSLEDGEVLPPKPIPHTRAAFNRADLATILVADATWASNGLPSHKKTKTYVTPLSHGKA